MKLGTPARLSKEIAEVSHAEAIIEPARVVRAGSAVQGAGTTARPETLGPGALDAP
jgi:hypothetical protein